MIGDPAATWGIGGQMFLGAQARLAATHWTTRRALGDAPVLSALVPPPVVDDGRHGGDGWGDHVPVLSSIAASLVAPGS